ncbi:2'-5'-oligoadenylate synthase 3-like [Dendronephthya gigantea]|uniref:2'-5'-oligoadenylate synthase 3-like n=1 Tax=Dendronephthya gigantea TaxID=151771 RepID=UPI00106C94B4|nr:2'-5'-oligoadenylate synthase 3-like [Dendronephthya gigantea]
MNSFICQHCSRSFPSIEKAVDHVHSHKLAQKPCVVPGCTTIVPNLTKHLKILHSNECKFPCDLCSRCFVHYNSMQQHKRDVVDCTIKKKRKKRPKKKKQTSSMFPPTPTPNIVDFRSPVTAAELNNFIAYNLQPTEEFKKEMKTTVGEICEFLKKHMKADRVVKGGSQGKGTAVRGKCDIDLVVILNDVRDAKDLKTKLPSISEEIKTNLKRYPAGFTIVPGSLTDSSFLVKFSVEGTHKNIDVDLLPTFKCKDFKSLYSKMKNDEENKEYYSVALAEKKVKFVRRQPANVKNLIRLVKYWKKEMVTPGGKIPNSYLMELITIHLWKENKRPKTFDTLKAFRGVMEALQDYQSLHVTWTMNSSDSEKKQGPLVMDPANPMNNVCSGFDWEEISRAAKEVLKSLMMDDVSSTNWK